MTEVLTSVLCTCASAIVSGVFTAIAAVRHAEKKADERQKATERGVQCLLRAELIRAYEKSRDRGYCPLYLKEAAERAYEAYHNLGGNDVATDLYRRLREMDTDKREKGE